MIQKLVNRGYSEFITSIYPWNEDYEPTASRVRNVTFQVTDDCCLKCSYCYQGHKGHRFMTKETAKKGVDLLFELYDKNEGTFINHNTKAIILDFIGGEPLMNIEVIDYICSYFMEECLRRDHPWTYTWRAAMISNGVLYFEPKVQSFLKKFKGFISFGITIDGPKEIHDICRKHHDGTGNFDEAFLAMRHYNENYSNAPDTKVTIAPENLADINKIIKFFRDLDIKIINANCAFEPEWNENHAKIFYKELKAMSDYLLDLNDETTVSLFREDIFYPMDSKDNNNWCGGTGAMLAFDPDGLAYPCLRYMPSSLGPDVPPLICGSVDEGIFEKPEHKALKEYLDSITRRSQSTDKCWECPIATGCAWCSGWNYQKYGTVNKRCTNICVMHKARSLANVYYWNKWYKQNGEDKKMKMWLPKEEALKIIDEAEYNMLLDLSKEED